MAVKMKNRIQVLERTFDVLLPEASEKEQIAFFRDFAEEKRDETLAGNRAILGYVPDYETRVDGVQNPSLSGLKVDSIVEYEFELASSMFAWIDELLVRTSPIGRANDPRPGHPGLYSKSHVLIADNAIVENPRGRIPQAEKYTFLNLVPYARKIERGHSSQAPNGVYEVVASMARQRFGNFGSIYFTYASPLGFGAIDAWASSTRMFRKGSAANRADWLRRQPAIVIVL